MESILEIMIRKSGLEFLRGIDFVEKTPGRFFQKDKLEFKVLLSYDNSPIYTFRLFHVVLGPNIESPIHNHAGQSMSETHFLRYGSGRFIIYNNNHEAEREIELVHGQCHEIFSTPDSTPNHKYVAGPNGSITLAVEIHYPKINAHRNLFK